MEHLAEPQQPMTLEQYFELERQALVRHEFVNGRLHAMTGATRRHNLIAINIVRKLADAADDTSCRVYMSDVKVQTPAGLVYYPDVMVSCTPVPENPYVVTKPCLIVEVISSTTELKDRREKLAAYRTIPTLQAYLIVDQDKQRVECHHRDEAGRWQIASMIGTALIPIPCPEGTLAMADIDIYEGALDG